MGLKLDQLADVSPMVSVSIALCPAMEVALLARPKYIQYTAVPPAGKTPDGT